MKLKYKWIVLWNVHPAKFVWHITNCRTKEEAVATLKDDLREVEGSVGVVLKAADFEDHPEISEMVKNALKE